MRLVFLARSERPDGDGYYPDHLTIKPHRMPGKYVVRARATEYFRD